MAEMDSAANGVAAGDAQQPASLDSILKTNDWLTHENKVLEDYLRRVYPSVDLGRPPEAAAHAHFTPLSPEEKANICSNELDHVLQLLSHVERKGQEELREVKIMLEEVDQRMAESRKRTHEFKRDIVLGAENPLTKKPIAEKFIRFMQDQAKSKATAIAKFELRNAGLKAHLLKLQRSVKQGEGGVTLHAVEFDQLQIENQRHLQNLSNKNVELAKMKKCMSKTVHALNAIKRDVKELLEQQARAGKDRQVRSTQAQGYEEYVKHTEAGIETTKEAIRGLKLAAMDTDQPKILDYIKVKHEVSELESKKADLQRKVLLAEMDVNRAGRIRTNLARGVLEGSSMKKMDDIRSRSQKRA